MNYAIFENNGIGICIQVFMMNLEFFSFLRIYKGIFYFNSPDLSIFDRNPVF
jgi:hypothetical protein